MLPRVKPEPLLQAEFIREFANFVRNNGKSWRFSIETSLAVEWTKVMLLVDLVDDWIVDLKDSNEEIYRAYTGVSGRLVRENLGRLAAICPDRVHVRLPLIPGFNDEESLEISHDFVRKLGITRIEKFKYIVKNQ